MTPFRNEQPAKFDGTAIASAEEDFREQRRALKDVSIEEVSRAVMRARHEARRWAQIPVTDRSSLLLKTAEILKKRRSDLSAFILHEVQKNWKEADADVCEAIDFLEYYAREALRIAEEGGVLKPWGVVAVIAPWNFPLAILTGMTSAALVTGNTVLMKPAEQSPVIAQRLFQILLEAGLPPDAVHLLPGPGETIGDSLVRSAEVDLVCFTGSKEVGMRIAGLKKRAIAEMGGKNAVIVDESADLEKAVEGTLLSAFGYQGQKCSACSRVLVLPAVYNEFRNRLVAATEKIRLGDPKDPENFMGPVIDDEAEAKIRRYEEIGRAEAVLLYQGKALKGDRYVPPTIFEEVPSTASIAREEIFGPLLCLMRAKDLMQALEIANGVPYDLTGGLFSNLPAHIERTKKEFEVGNLYINRKITGALVACQPFGGYRISSLGFKAGGPEYLYQFLESPKMPFPPERRELPRSVPEEKNELLSIPEGPRLLSKTICERILHL